MHVFPAKVPAAETSRSDVVETRVARKVAALFGLGDGIDPYRRSWVCDYTTLSLAEIGRGAPNPGRADQSRLDADPSQGSRVRAQGGWAWAGRAVWTPQRGHPPGAISNATLNRYGPDTKAGAVLAAANRLLQGSAVAVADVGRYLAGIGCDAEVRLAVWAGLVLEVYRAQPALVVAGVQARQVQRSLSAWWGAQVDRAGVAGPGAPCELQSTSVPDDEVAPDDPARRWRPTLLDLVDATLPAFGLANDTPGGPGLVSADAIDDAASAWCHRLLAVGRPGRGVVWLVEDSDGSRHVHAMVRVGAVVAPFVAATLGGSVPSLRVSPPTLPVVPTAEFLADAPLLHRRAYLLAAHVATNYVRYRDELLLDWPGLRAKTRDLVDDAVHRCAEVVDTDDPVALQLRAYAAYLHVWDRRRCSGQDGADPAAPPRATGAAAGDGLRARTALARLVESQRAVMAAWRSGRLDPGAATYLLEIAAVAVHDAAADPDEAWSGRRRPPAEMPAQEVVGEWWSAILRSRGLDPAVDMTTGVSSVSDAQVFHLHHYAAWLAHSRRLVDLRRALALQERVAAVRAEVTRREPAGFAAKSTATRAAYERAAGIATDLALVTPEREHGARARALEASVGFVRRVLGDPSTGELLGRAGAHSAALPTAGVVARALSTAAANGVAVDAADVVAATALIDRLMAGGGADGVGPGRAALAALRAWRDQMSGSGAGRPAGAARSRRRR